MTEFDLKFKNITFILSQLISPRRKLWASVVFRAVEVRFSSAKFVIFGKSDSIAAQNMLLQFFVLVSINEFGALSFDDTFNRLNCNIDGVSSRTINDSSSVIFALIISLLLDKMISY